MTFTIEAGKRYVRGDGEISGVLKWNGHDRVRLMDPKHYTVYESDGKLKGKVTTNPRYDLICEYRDTVIVEEPTAEPQDEWGPWHGWNGGECPVDGDAVVETMLETGQRFIEDASEWNWSETMDGAIIAYRVKIAKPNPKAIDVWINEHGCGSTAGGFIFSKDRKAIITLTDGVPSIRWAE